MTLLKPMPRLFAHSSTDATSAPDCITQAMRPLDGAIWANDASTWRYLQREGARAAITDRPLECRRLLDADIQSAVS